MTAMASEQSANESYYDMFDDNEVSIFHSSFFAFDPPNSPVAGESLLWSATQSVFLPSLRFPQEPVHHPPRLVEANRSPLHSSGPGDGLHPDISMQGPAVPFGTTGSCWAVDGT